MENTAKQDRETGKPGLPVLFVGHGNPMNAIADNRFTRTLSELGRGLARPEAILCVSAHWTTEGSWVTHMPKPRTIHDFYGFPKALFDVRYEAPGSPETAELVRRLVRDPKIHLDDETWGLDHGSWSVLKHLYPQADVPVVQLSLDLGQPAEYHYGLGRSLRALRNRGVLLVASGNLVHNLRRLRWEDEARPYDWAVEFDEWAKARLLARDDRALLHDALKSEAGRESIPTLEHYLPLFYILGAAHEDDELRFVYEGLENGSISMRGFTFG